MPKGILYSVATPIGNLGDITLRAIDTLRTADLIVCEDTRETQKLLGASRITGKRLLSYHAHSRGKKEDEIIAALRSGQSVALVSDRGTPGISDPGSLLVSRAIEAGFSVVPIPGPSAIIAALQAAGAETHSFLYLGFLPHKKRRQTMLQEIASESRTVIFYESPHRLMKTLTALRDCGRRIVVARELTKVYEEFIRGTSEEVLELFEHRPHVVGECVVIVYGHPNGKTKLKASIT